MNHRMKILSEIAEGVEDVAVPDDAEAKAREAISDAILEYERLLCLDEVRDLVSPFIENEVVYDDDMGIVITTEEDFDSLDNTFEEDGDKFAVKAGKRYRLSAIEEYPTSKLAHTVYSSMVDLASRYVEAQEIGTVQMLMLPAIDETHCPVCQSSNTDFVYEENGAYMYLCHECLVSFAVDQAPVLDFAVEPDYVELGPDISSNILATPEGMLWEVFISGEPVSSGIAQGYQEALGHCKTWYETYIGIEPGTVYASTFTGSDMQVTSKSASEVTGTNLKTGKPFSVKTSMFIDQLASYELVRSASNVCYADTAEVGSQFQGVDGNLIEVTSKVAGMVEYADTSVAGNMYDSGMKKWLPTQEFYSMLDTKDYVVI